MHRTEAELVWLDNRDQIKLDIRKMVRRLENELIEEARQYFQRELSKGNVVALRQPEETIRALMRAKALEITSEPA